MYPAMVYAFSGVLCRNVIYGRESAVEVRGDWKMATHKIGNFKFNLSKRGFAYRIGEGEIHRIPFGKAASEEYEEDYAAYDDDAVQGYDDVEYAEDEYEADRRYARDDYDEDYDRDYDRDDVQRDYIDEDEGDRTDDYQDDEYEQVSPFMQYVEENDWVTLVLLVLLPPLGIYLLWRRNAFESIMRYALTGLSAAWCLILLVLVFSSIFSGTSDTTTAQLPNTLPSLAPTASTTPSASPEESAIATQPGIDLGLKTSAAPSASPSATPLAGAATSSVGDFTATGGNDTAGLVYSPASGLYYHSNRDCTRIPAGVSVSTVTVAVAESRNQYRCPTCYNLEVFYATAGGSSYHTDKNCQNMRNAVEYTKEAAEGSGKTACATCILHNPTTTTGNTGTAANVSDVIKSINTDKSGITVYMTDGGQNYHNNATCRGMQNAKAVSLLTALKSGKTACTTCLPQASKQVYCTQNGENYHSNATCRGMQNAKKVDLAVALVMGKTACATCIGTGGATATPNANNAAPTPTPRTSGGPEVENGTVYVYGTANGKYYHTYPVCGDMTNGTRVKLSFAIAQKREPCPVCCKGANTKVYAMEGGTYYHCDPTCSDMPSAREGTLAEALAYGYKRCPICWEKKEEIERQEAEDKSGIEVYTLENGRYYHTKSNCNDMQGATKVKLGVALAMGKEPCPECADFADRTVYAAVGETYYHYDKNHAANGAKAGTLAEALVYGFKACPDCVEGAGKATATPTASGTPAAGPTSSNTYRDGTSGKTVYASANGTYYHLSKACAGNDADAVTLEKALNYGKVPCPDCATYASRTVYAKVGEPYYHYEKAHAGDGATGGQLAKALAFGFKACPVCVEGTQTATVTPGTTLAPGVTATPTPVPGPTSSNTYQEGTSGKKVYASLNGKYYHLSKTCAGNGADYVTLEKALNYGKSACPDCASYASQTVYAKIGEPYYHYDKEHAGNGASGGQLAKALAYGFKACPLCVNGNAGGDDVGATPTPVVAAPGNTSVYIDLDGTTFTYHKASKCPEVSMSNVEEVTLNFALEWDYEPCPYCKPPKEIG